MFDAPPSLDELSLVEMTTTQSRSSPPIRSADMSPGELMSSLLVFPEEPNATQFQADVGMPSMGPDGGPEVTQAELYRIFGSVLPADESWMLLDHGGPTTVSSMNEDQDT
jgi:hypothetical protein